MSFKIFYGFAGGLFFLIILFKTENMTLLKRVEY